MVCLEICFTLVSSNSTTLRRSAEGRLANYKVTSCKQLVTWLVTIIMIINFVGCAGQGIWILWFHRWWWWWWCWWVRWSSHRILFLNYIQYACFVSYTPFLSGYLSIYRSIRRSDINVIVIFARKTNKSLTVSRWKLTLLLLTFLTTKHWGVLIL